MLKDSSLNIRNSSFMNFNTSNTGSLLYIQNKMNSEVEYNLIELEIDNKIIL